MMTSRLWLKGLNYFFSMIWSGCYANTRQKRVMTPGTLAFLGLAR